MSARYLIRRLVGALFTLLGVAVLVFIALRVLPGDEITARLGVQAGLLTDAQRDALEQYYGLDKPPATQFFSWLGSVLTGNLGVALTSGNSAASLILAALPVTLELAVLSTLIGAALGVTVGVAAASKPLSVRDVVGQTFGLLGLAVPTFVLAAAVVAVLSGVFQYLPTAGEYVGLFENPFLNLQQMLYPALVLGVALAATVMRTTRSAYLEAAGQDFVRTARGKGLAEGRIRWRHILHNATVPIVTIIGIQFGYLLGGTVVVEYVFALPGLGRLVLVSILQREYAVVQSTVLVIAVGFVLVNLAVDLLYAKLDPRVHLT